MVKETLTISEFMKVGSIVAHYEYSPFGEQVVSAGLLAYKNPYRFSTKYVDDETAFSYYGYRYYSASLGRWLSIDPIEEKGFEIVYLGNHIWNRNMFSSIVNRQATIFSKSCSGNKCVNGSSYVSQCFRGSYLSNINLSQTRVSQAYDFVQNNPIVRVDLLGLSDCVCPPGSHKGKRQKTGYTPTPNGCTGVGPGPFDFTSACNAHDICYGTCNSDKSACDINLYNDAISICSQRCGTDVNCLFWCGLVADTYYAGVFWGGSSYYATAQNEACEDCCCP